MSPFGPGKSFLSIPLLNTLMTFKVVVAGELGSVSLSECVGQRNVGACMRVMDCYHTVDTTVQPQSWWEYNDADRLIGIFSRYIG